MTQSKMTQLGFRKKRLALKPGVHVRGSTIPRIDSVIAEHPSGWVLVQRYEESRGWIEIKVVRVRGRRRGETRKYAFWSSWCVKENRLRRNADSQRLQDEHPDIHDWVLALLKGK